MNFETERRTNPVRIAFSRIQAFVEAHKMAFLINDIGCFPEGLGYWLLVIYDLLFEFSTPMPA
jgi:hypothetical protein